VTEYLGASDDISAVERLEGVINHVYELRGEVEAEG
jgi:hypothetical protein